MQLPEGMVCSGQVGEATNVCVAKLQNATPAGKFIKCSFNLKTWLILQPGPFGGAIAFTQSTGAKKRAIIFNLRKRNFARALKRDLSIAELEALVAATDSS